MRTELEIALRDDNIDESLPDVILVPTARHEGTIKIPVGLPDSIAGIALPTSIDPAFAERHRFTAERGQTLLLSQSPGTPTLLAVGIGDPTASDDEAWRRAAAAGVRAARGSRAILLVTLPSTVIELRLGEAIATGAYLALHRTDLKSSEPRPSLEVLDVALFAPGGVSLQASESLSEGLANGLAVARAVALTRDLVNRVPSELTPRRLAASLLRRLEKAANVEATVWREARIEEERLGGLLGVARGSSEAPRLLLATYDPARPVQHDEEPASRSPRKYIEPEDPAPAAAAQPAHVILVGKGVTFDSGGLSLKTATGMTTMKTDMTGAAVVMAAILACSELGVKAKVTAIAPMTENMPGGAAMKPGDVLTARDGTTIEVLNTDAEGRLILADALTLAVERKPDAIIDVATLTGAAVVALGSSMGAVMGNDQALIDEVLAAAKIAGEPMWQLPLVADYEGQLDSDIADLKNIGSPGEAGSITAGLFLKRFVGEVPWAHLDIAGPARADKDEGYTAKGGTGFSLRTLLTYLRSLG